MAKKQAKHRKIWNKKPLVFTIVFLVLVFSSVAVSYAVVWIKYQRSIGEQVGAETTRELIVRAVEGIKPNAPIDPKTGDVYFPEARLYLPAASAMQLTYSYDSPGEGGHEQLNISNKLVLNQNVAKLYTGRTLEEVFAAVPKLQSCQRGIALVYSDAEKPSADSGMELKQTVRLNNGKDLYFYLEKECPELAETAESLKNLQAY
jgi:hypothetical protein